MHGFCYRRLASAALASLCLISLDHISVEARQADVEELDVSWTDLTCQQSLLQAHVKIDAKHTALASQRSTASLVGRDWICSYGVITWIVFGVIAVGWAWKKPVSDQSESRDGRWDMVKFWAMVFVIWAQLLEFVVQDDTTRAFRYFFSRINVTSFSFVSGVFASLCPMYERNAEGRLVVSEAKLGSSLRDLVLVHVTIVPVSLWFKFWYGFFALVPLDSNPWLAQLWATPMLVVPGAYWYLAALLFWQFVTPMLCLARWPVLIAAVVSVVCRGYHEQGPTFYFVYFVLGYVLAGGGKTAEERATCRETLELQLVGTATRAVAFGVLVLWILLSLLPLSEPLQIVFSWKSDFYPEATPWKLGGWLTDVARLAWSGLLTMAFITGCFAIQFPGSKHLCQAGSATLYVYVLQGIALFDNHDIKDTLNWYIPQAWKPAAAGVVALLFTFMLGCQLMKTLTHVFVQPKWLVDLLTIGFTSLAKQDAAADAAPKLPSLLIASQSSY